MTYRIEGLSPEPYHALFGMRDAELTALGAVRMTVTTHPGFPCRISLDDAEPGETVLLVNHVSHDFPTPYRASHAIFVKEHSLSARFEDSVPPALDRRILSLRAFDRSGMMTDAVLAQPGEADSAIRGLLADSRIDHIDAHNAIRGCFAARIERN